MQASWLWGFDPFISDLTDNILPHGQFSEELNILTDVTRSLEKLGIPYMITGSMALNYYATPRMTRDIDIVIELKREDIERVVHSFQKDFYIESEMIQEALETRGLFNIIHNETLIKVDFIVRKNESYRKVEFERRKKVEMAGHSFWIVSPEDLILSKLHWAKEGLSERQLSDVKNILIEKKDLDINYLEKWVHDLDLESLFKEIRK